MASLSRRLGDFSPRAEYDRFLTVLGAVFLGGGLGLILALVGVGFFPLPLLVWGGLGGLATQVALPVVAWSRGQAYRPSSTSQVGTVLLAVGGLSLGLAGVPGVTRAVGTVARMGWLFLLFAGCLVLVHLLRAGGRDGMPLPTERFAPAFAQRGNRTWDEVARWEVVAALGYVVLAAVAGLEGGWGGSTADPVGVLVWYGWLASLAASSSLFYLPRLLGVRPDTAALVVAARLLWHVGIVASLLFHLRGLLACTSVGGVLLFAALLKLFQASGRRVLRVVGSRRVDLLPLYRQLLFLAAVFGLLASLTVPWWKGLHSGASHILWTWMLFLFVPLLAHVFGRRGRLPTAPVVGVLSAGIVASLLGIWPGPAAAFGVLLMSLSAFGVGAVMLFQGLGGERAVVDRIDSGTHERRS